MRDILKECQSCADWSPNKYGTPIKFTENGELVVQLEDQSIQIIKNVT